VLGKILYEFVQAVYYSVDNVDELSLGGFPVLVTPEVYSRIAELMGRYGAVAVEHLTGILVRAPDFFPLAFAHGWPKWCLLVGSRSHLRAIRKPRPVICSAWTVTIDDNLGIEPTDKYLQWMFLVGVRDWRYQLERAVGVIETVQTKVGATAVFEFDEEYNWFGPYTQFTPRTMRALFQRMRNAQYVFEISPLSCGKESKDGK